MPMIEVTEENFGDMIKEGIVLVDFSATWCGPCKMLTPVLDALADEYAGVDGVEIIKVDIDKCPNLASSYQITSVPTIKLMKNGSEVDTIVGVQQADHYKSKIESHR